MERKPGFEDVIILAGLAMASWGLWSMWPPLMWLVLGVVVMAVGLAAGAQRVSDRISAQAKRKRADRHDE